LGHAWRGRYAAWTGVSKRSCRAGRSTSLDRVSVMPCVRLALKSRLRKSPPSGPPARRVLRPARAGCKANTVVQERPMLRQLLVGTAISVCNIAIHALMMATVVHMSSRIAGAKDTVRQSRWQDRFDRSKMTHLRHRHDRNPAAQRFPCVLFLSFESTRGTGQ
jgi:hypothetical protein